MPAGNVLVPSGIADPFRFHVVQPPVDGVAALTEKYDTNRDGVISAAEATHGYYGAVLKLRQEIEALKDKTVTVTTVFHNEGSIGMPGTGGGGTGDYQQNSAVAGANN